MKKGKYRKAVFSLVYSIVDGKPEYIILKRKKHWKGWEFPKGKIEKGENKIQTVRRETKEETGLKAVKIKRFHISGLYRYKKFLKDRPGVVGQTYTLYSTLVKKGNGKIKVDSIEHYYGKWVGFSEAYNILTWVDQKRCLKIVDKWLNKRK